MRFIGLGGLSIPDMPAPIMTTVALVKSLFPTGRRVLIVADILERIEHVPFERQVNRGQRSSGYNPELPRRQTIVLITQPSGYRGQLSFAYASLMQRVSKLQEIVRDYSIP